MAEYAYDLIVIGAGSGGLAGAKRAASYGAKVAIIENDRVGGTCVIRGCVPKKLMVYASELGHAASDASGYGWSDITQTHDWATLAARRNAEVARLEALHERLLGEAGVELLRGSASLVAADTVALGGKELTARHVLIATGSTPVLPDIEGVDLAITSDGLFELERAPKRVAIVGGGYISVEFACVLNGLGCDVSLIFRRELPLRGFDENIRAELDQALMAQGIHVLRETRVERLDRADRGVLLTLDGAAGPRTHEVDQSTIYAVGRTPNTAGLGLDELGVELGVRSEVLTDIHGFTNVDGVMAVGDVTGRAALTPVAIQASRLLADRVFGGKTDVTMSYDDIPTAVFTSPPIGTVGLTEEEARKIHGEKGIDVYRSGFTPMFHALTERKSRTFMKLIVEKASDRVLGCHMIGTDAAEIIQGFGVALKAGATKADFDATVGIHPSAAEEFVTMT